ncbi:hypothetical protein ACWEJP_05120 [Streptomyces sp. NPDC004749]
MTDGPHLAATGEGTGAGHPPGTANLGRAQIGSPGVPGVPFGEPDVPRPSPDSTAQEAPRAPDGQEPRQDAPARTLRALLLGLRQEARSGTVRVSGTPGGTIHLRDGLIVAIESPGTPSVESALLKSGRIDEEGWARALATARETGAEGDALGATLVARGLVGAVELEVLCAATVFEGAFALSLGRTAEWETAEPSPVLRCGPGIEPRAAAEETTRRLALVSRLWGPAAELARARTRPSSQAERTAGRLPRRYQSLLTAANGRRTPRDLAFVLGRGLFGVMVDLIRMNDIELLQWEGARPAGRPSTAPRLIPTEQSPPAAPSATLPRRVPRARPDRLDP